jgi:hypothetical protein
VELVQHSSHNPEKYIESMKSLITDYPDVHFVFMTGHTEGTCENAAVDLRNNIIRDFYLLRRILRQS